MSIEAFKAAANKKSSGTHVKIADGDSITGVFIGEPVMYYNHFQDKKKYSKWVEGSTHRFRWNFAEKTTDGWKCGIYDGPMGFGKDLWTAIEEYGQDTLFKITRKGEGVETRYSVMYVKDQPESFDEPKGLDQFDLSKYIEDPFDLTGANEVPYKDDPAPTDADMPAEKSEEAPF